MGCYGCKTPIAHIECGLCKNKVCKSCAQFLEDDDFSLMPVRPEELMHDSYCYFCFDTTIAPQLNAYNETVDKAKNISVYFKSHNKETHHIRRDEKPIQIANCNDYNETIMRMAYLAVEKKFNAIIDVDLVSTKEKLSGTFFKHIWAGKAIPANVDEKKLMRDRTIRHNPN